MSDCPETSGNRPWRVRQVSGKWTKSLVIPALFELYTVKSTRGLELPVTLSIYRIPAGNLLETYRKSAGNLLEILAASFRRFPEVSSQSVIDGLYAVLVGGQGGL